jgi:hypothetical protein
MAAANSFAQHSCDGRTYLIYVQDWNHDRRSFSLTVTDYANTWKAEGSKGQDHD